jgi:hypothetical protein
VVEKKNDVLRLDSFIFLYGHHTGSNACGCGSAAIAATVAAAARDSSRRPGYGRYQDCSLHNEEAFFMFLILSRNFILFDLNNHRGCMSNRLVLKTFEKHS